MSDPDDAPRPPAPEPEVLPPDPALAPPDLLPLPPVAPLPRPDPERMAAVVSISPRDDLVAICGRIDAAGTQAVVVSAPRGNRHLATELGMVRLAHHAEDTGRSVAVATKSRALSARARQVGVPVGRRPDRIRWDAAGHRVLWLGRYSLVLPAAGRYGGFALLLLVLLVGGAAAAAVGPSATIVASPPLRDVARDIEILVLPGADAIDIEAISAPGVEVTSVRRYTVSVPTTGTVPVPVGHATVLITIANTARAPVIVLEGAILVAADGTRFRLDRETAVPAGSSAIQQASAVEPGPRGNIAAGTLTRFQDAQYADLRVSNAGPAAGGAVEERPGVDPRDVQSLQALARGLLASPVVQEQLLADHPHAAVVIETATASAAQGPPRPRPGEPGALVFAEIEIRVRALAISPEQLEALAGALLQSTEGATELVPGTAAIEPLGPARAGTRGSYRLPVRLTGSFAEGVTSGAIRDAAAGKTPGSARSTLRERYGMQEVEVRLSPGWAPWLPRLGSRITVELRGASADGPSAPLVPVAADVPTPTPTATPTPEPTGTPAAGT